jgi:hypothetical protein
MFAGSDLIMVVLAVILAVSFVRMRDTARAATQVDLDDYNAYLATLGKKNSAPNTEESGQRPRPVQPSGALLKRPPG